MYDELVKTLRLRAALWEKMYDEDNVLKQAADAIEELRTRDINNLKHFNNCKHESGSCEKEWIEWLKGEAK